MALKDALTEARGAVIDAMTVAVRRVVEIDATAKATRAVAATRATKAALRAGMPRHKAQRRRAAKVAQLPVPEAEPHVKVTTVAMAIPDSVTTVGRDAHGKVASKAGATAVGRAAPAKVAGAPSVTGLRVLKATAGRGISAIALPGATTTTQGTPRRRSRNHMVLAI